MLTRPRTRRRSLPRLFSPYIFVHYETLNYAMQPRVHGSHHVLPSLELQFKNVWLS